MSDRDLISAAPAAARGLADIHAFSPIGWWDWDLTEERPWWNDEMCRIYGVPEGAGLTMDEFRALIHPDDLTDVDGRLGRREVSESTYRIIRPDGEMRLVLGRRSGRFDAEGRLTHLYGTVQDLTAQHLAERERDDIERRLREAEAEVRRERDHARIILAAMHEGYALTVGGEIVDVNDALCELTGLERAELIGSVPPYPFWPPELARELTGERERHFQAGVGGTFEAVFQRADGARFDAEVTARPAFEIDGTPIGYVNTIRDVSLRNRERRELERRARTDSLTGLANRYVLDEQLARAADGGSGDGTALVLFDLDRFKQINDEHGHPVGDAVLVEVAVRLSAIVREGEVLARVGGEEFAWLLPGRDVTGARAVADRARVEIAAAPFGEVGALTVSAGIAVTDVPCSPARLYAAADRALYEAKRSGRDRTCCASPGDAADPRRIPSTA